MINQEFLGFEGARTFGFAQCKVSYNDFSKVENIICLACNEAFAEILNATPEQLIQQPLSLPNYNIIDYLNGTCLVNEVLYSINQAHYKIEIIKNAEHPSQIQIIITDITKQIEYHNVQNINAYTETTANALEDSFLNLVTNSREPMLLYSGGEFLLANLAAANFLGYDSPEELLNVSPVDLSPEYQPNGMLSSEASPIMNARAIETGYCRFEWVHLKKDKTPVYLDVTLTYMILRNQPVLHCVWHDISKTKQLEEEVVLQQQKTLDQLSIPITQIFRDMLLLPLIGNITPVRAQNIMHKVLQKISDTQSKVIILDIGGIDDMNTLAAEHLIKLSNATRMMGCTTILASVSGKVAEILTTLDMDISAINSAGTLENAIHKGCATLGININFKDK